MTCLFSFRILICKNTLGSIGTFSVGLKFIQNSGYSSPTKKSLIRHQNTLFNLEPCFLIIKLSKERQGVSPPTRSFKNACSLCSSTIQWQKRIWFAVDYMALIKNIYIKIFLYTTAKQVCNTVNTDYMFENIKEMFVFQV